MLCLTEVDTSITEEYRNWQMVQEKPVWNSNAWNKGGESLAEN